MAWEWAPAFIAGQEWIVIVVLAAILIFGAKKIPELAKTLGRSRGEYEKGKMEGEQELARFRGGKGDGGPDDAAGPGGAGGPDDAAGPGGAGGAGSPPKAGGARGP